MKIILDYVRGFLGLLSFRSVFRGQAHLITGTLIVSLTWAFSGFATPLDLQYVQDPLIKERILSWASQADFRRFVPSVFRDKQKERLQAVLQKSVFNQDPFVLTVEGKNVPYDPALIAVTASMYSRLPKRDDSQYTQIDLPPVDNFRAKHADRNSPCPYDMRSFVKISKKETPHTFVILPGAYATWKRGSFNNQTIAILDKRFDDPNIISFAGYLSPAFLEGTCDKIPWDAQTIALDKRARLSVLLKKIKADPDKTGLIGFSGGAGLVVAMLAQDAKEVSETGKGRLFGLGGASFSPTLHGLSIYHNLDASVSGIEHQKALTSLDLDQLWFMAKAYVRDWALDWRDIVDLYIEDPDNYRQRFFNEFTHIDLADTLKAVEFDLGDVNGEFGYYNAYVNTGFRGEVPSILRTMAGKWDADMSWLNKSKYGGLSKEELNLMYSHLNNIVPAFKAVDKPLLIYFSKDDSILSSYDDSGQPEPISQVLDVAKRNSHITVFNPDYGAHIGHFLDPIFEELLWTFFTKPPKEVEADSVPPTVTVNP